MTSPQDPFAAPGDGAGGQPPGQGGQQWGQQPGQQQPHQSWGPAGYGQPAYGQPDQTAGTNGLAIAALVCAFLCSPLGIILGFVARRQISRTGQGGAGLALAAILIACVSIALGVILLAAGYAISPSRGVTTY